MVSLPTALILLSGCLLEVSTGIPRPLDAAYITPRTEGGPARDASPPWAALEGDTVKLHGMISAAGEGPVDLDFWVEDTETLGGWTLLGRLNLEAPGAWTIEAPAGFGQVFIEGFQDAYGDGPTPDDPFGGASVIIAEEDLEVPEVPLDEGSRFETLSARFARQAPFADYSGDIVRISGVISTEVEQLITVDLRSLDEFGEAVFEGVILVAEAGPWHLDVPTDFGELQIQALQDQRGDGPSADDTFASVTILIAEVDLESIDLELAAGALAVSGTDQPLPFKDYQGETIRLAGQVISDQDGPVQIDVRTVDPAAEGGFEDDGKLDLSAPRSWTFKAPVSHGQLLIQAFQDLTEDGPTDDDPFGFVLVEVGEEPLLDQTLTLKIGGKLELARAMGHGEGEASIKSCRDWDGPTLLVSGTVVGGQDRPVSLDFRVPDDNAEGGVTQICREELAEPGEWRAEISARWPQLMIEGFQDVDQNGPSERDPYGEVTVPLDGVDVAGVTIEMVVGARQDDHGGDGEPGDGHGGAPGGAPAFEDYQGDWVKLKGMVDTEYEGSISFDFAVPDPAEPGGRRRLGLLRVEQGGEYALKVPKDLGQASLEIFQDLNKDGPTDDDPYAVADVEVGAVDVVLSVRLIQGARGQPAGGGDPNGGGGGGGSPKSTCFSDLGRNPVTVAGTLRASDEGVGGQAKLDLFVSDPTGQGGRRQLCSLHVPLGRYSFEVPEDFGSFELEAFIDLDNDGPSPGDPFGQYAGNPVEVRGEDIQGVDLLLEPSGGRAEGI